MFELLIVPVVVGVAIVLRPLRALPIEHRACYWCGAVAVCTSGVADTCREHHKQHHAIACRQLDTGSTDR